MVQPRPQGLLRVQNGGRRNLWPRLPKWLQKFVRISSRKHDETSSFCLNNGFRLQKTNRAARHWKQRPKKPFYHVSRDKILHDSWSISAALARGSLTAILNEEKTLGTGLRMVYEPAIVFNEIVKRSARTGPGTRKLRGLERLKQRAAPHYRRQPKMEARTCEPEIGQRGDQNHRFPEKPLISPVPFDGKTAWDDYRVQFELIADLNG